MGLEVPAAGQIISTKKSKKFWIAGILLMFMAVIVIASVFWLASRATIIKTELGAAEDLVQGLRKDITSHDPESASVTVKHIREKTAAARDAADDPLWTLASSVPVVGPNFSAVAEISRSADDIATLSVAPLVAVYGSMNWDELVPSDTATDLDALQRASPSISAAAQAVSNSAARLNQIDSSELVGQVAAPLDRLRQELTSVTGAVSISADVAKTAPGMLGADEQHTYLLMIQNNAEARASGGIPGALAVLTLDKGKLSLGPQSSAGDVGVISPVISVDPQQQQIYSSRLGKYLQDVNLTPDFPTAATIAQAMWEKKTGQRVDGVISIDPIVLSYILQSTGPVSVNGPELAAVKASGLPTVLTGENVVPTLLSDVYAKIKQPKLQDAYFAGVAKEVFSALSSGKGEAKGLISGITRGTEEGRVLIWSAKSSEQSVISKYALSGSISGPSVSPAQFGVYFNDGTGAKMDYYVKRTVKLIKECPADGYEQTTVRVTSTNTAPSDAATSLPAYVTGAGAFGVAPGTVQTNVVAYGPAQANVESATIDGQKTPFAPYIHANRPVGVVAQQLAPGESKTVEFTFGKIVQHTEPNVVVTPTVQPVKDVILPTENASCDPGQ
ncbi:uncharacterized protein DUF4012 [Arthrobacter sp. AG258]|uniref:DUF4012 domain-containing protein n=1 Tax=Arthrobacter sp. AG258 TaxID=2183899 RepID=UPI0010DA81EC|nr:DUF4012 domain-containing protein [Arthrobacter sp. AG258]TDT85951.1 uncharacterized protein DUF4012 [Arthrobacter sp. AG258]